MPTRTKTVIFKMCNLGCREVVHYAIEVVGRYFKEYCFVDNTNNFFWIKDELTGVALYGTLDVRQR